MMDQQCIDSIIRVITRSNMSDLDLVPVEIRPVRYEIGKDGKETTRYNIELSDCFGMKAQLSEAWVASNLLLFTTFDGVLENLYLLTEGASFKNHYNGLPESTDFEVMTKNCYRVLKIIRNAIQHNLSSVHYHQGNIQLNYHHKNAPFSLQITHNGIRWLYTYIINFITNHIYGTNRLYNTRGYYEGLMRDIYSRFASEISGLSDDLGTKLLPVSNGLRLRATVRHPIENPKLIAENNDSVTFYHLESNSTDDENDPHYQYSTDYIFGDYILPQEIGNRIRCQSDDLQDRLTKGTITFRKKDLTDLWKVK